jgi:hypothetical protein
MRPTPTLAESFADRAHLAHKPRSKRMSKTLPAAADHRGDQKGTAAGAVGRVRPILIGGLAAIVAVGIGLASAWAQGTAAAFDGAYAGTATATSSGGRGHVCPGDSSLQMTIAASRATIRTVEANGKPGPSFSGAIDPSGKVSATAQDETWRYLNFAGSIQGQNGAGTIDGVRCHWDVSLTKK